MIDFALSSLMYKREFPSLILSFQNDNTDCHYNLYL